MRHWFKSFLLLISIAIAVPALASLGGGNSQPPPPPSSMPMPSGDNQTSARESASREYGDAYENVGKAKKDLADGKAKNAEKKFKKALQRGEKAVEIDTTYHEAWNLVGYCARQLKDYDRSLAAYEHCLRIKPDYVPAREYLGEAYIELGKPAEAREQLAWLEKSAAEEEMDRLKAAIDAYEKAHPEAMTAAPRTGTIEAAATAAPVDTLTSPQTPQTK